MNKEELMIEGYLAMADEHARFTQGDKGESRKRCGDCIKHNICTFREVVERYEWGEPLEGILICRYKLSECDVGISDCGAAVDTKGVVADIV